MKTWWIVNWRRKSGVIEIDVSEGSKHFVLSAIGPYWTFEEAEKVLGKWRR